MKTHTQEFKDKIKELGRELDSKITYGEVELGNEQLNSITPHYEGALLKSVMKQLDIDSNVDIPLETEVNYQFGVKTRRGVNIYEGSKDFSGDWYNSSYWETDGSTFNGCVVKKRAGSWQGMYKSFSFEEGETYTYSIYVKSDEARRCALYLDNAVTPSYFEINTTTTWQRYSVTFTARANANNIRPRVENTTNSSTNYTYIACPQLEKGTSVTQYEDYGTHDYINYGNYIVFSSEKQEDTRSYKIVCYDKMLYSMKEYNGLESSLFPMTIRTYITKIAELLGLTFKNENDTFPNYDKILQSDPYIQDDGSTLNYTYRDILDELSQVTASTICLDENDELELRDIKKDVDIAPLPMEYQQVEYIESTGTQYIDTGVQLGTNNFTISSKLTMVEHKSPEQALFSIWTSTYNYWNVFLRNDDYLDLYINGHSIIYHPIPFGDIINIKLEKTSDNWKLTYNDYEVSKTYTISNANNTTLKIFTRGDTPTSAYSYTSMRLYNFYIKVGSSLVRDFVPCYRISDNVIGLYDLVNGVFYTNQGSGTFTKGENIYDTIDEEYLKDINVNFGEKYGPINSLVISRSADSDAIDRRDQESINENGLCEFKISENQILNGNNRDEYIEPIFNKIKGTEYYINDYSSTGVCYYDLLDRYNVKVDNNYYSCLMLNDEANITQGLVENIHTDMPEKSETDYSKTSQTDKMLRQTWLQVNKNSGLISSYVGKTDEIEANLQGVNYDDLRNVGTLIQQNIDGVKIWVTSNYTDTATLNTEGLSKLVTKLVRIDDNGISVESSSSKVATNMDNNAFSVVPKGSSTPLAYLGYDEVEGTSKAEMDNLKVKKYFISGYHRTEGVTIDGEYRTCDFYIGG